jgi:hypothetical protein
MFDAPFGASFSPAANRGNGPVARFRRHAPHESDAAALNGAPLANALPCADVSMRDD